MNQEPRTKNAIKWARLSRHGLRKNEVRLQLHVMAHDIANFLRTLALPTAIFWRRIAP